MRTDQSNISATFPTVVVPDFRLGATSARRAAAIALVALAALGGGCGGDASKPLDGGLDATDATACPSPSISSGWMSDGASAQAPATLADTGLYCDQSAFLVSGGIRPFQPKFPLWSDGAEKSRWVYLPPGSKIDVSDIDHWSFPVGARFWKEFRYQGKRVETRFITRTGTGRDAFLFATYRWNASETQATLVSAAGMSNAAPILPGPDSPMHDIPSGADCITCHGKLPEHILGMGAIQSSHSLGGLTITDLIDENLLTPAQTAGFPVPGDSTDQAALGYLHGNCSHCHNQTPTGVTYPYYMLRLRAGDTTVERTAVYQTAVNVLHTWLAAPAGVGKYRIEGGDATDSEVYFRTGVRIPSQQMPPIATKIIDVAGRTLLKQWIDGLPPPAGSTDGGSRD